MSCAVLHLLRGLRQSVTRPLARCRIVLVPILYNILYAMSSSCMFTDAYLFSLLDCKQSLFYMYNQNKLRFVLNWVSHPLHDLNMPSHYETLCSIGSPPIDLCSIPLIYIYIHNHIFRHFFQLLLHMTYIAQSNRIINNYIIYIYTHNNNTIILYSIRQYHCCTSDL